MDIRGESSNSVVASEETRKAAAYYCLSCSEFTIILLP